MEVIAERVQNGLRAVVPGEKLFHGNIASGFHGFPPAERAKNEPEPPDVKSASSTFISFRRDKPSSRKAGFPRQPKSAKISVA
jgi:hypothetical protein